MAFNNLAFNVSKSTPTTSATNTTSITASTGSSSSEISTSTSQPKSSFLQEVLSKSATEAKSPKLVGPAVSEAAPAIVTKGEENSQATAHQQHSPKRDLIELFDKFDLKSKVAAANAEDEIDDIEHKFDQFTPKAETAQQEKTRLEKHDDTESFDTSDAIHEKHEHNLTHEHESEQGESPVASSSFTNTVPFLQFQSKNAPATGVIEQDGCLPDKNDSPALSGTGDTSASQLNQTEESPSSLAPIVESTTSTNEDGLPDQQRSALTMDEEQNMNQDLTEEALDEAAPMKSEGNYLEQIPQTGGSNSQRSQHSWSSKPFDFHIFLQHLKKKSADPIARYIRSFLVSFNKQNHTFTLQQKVKIVHDFKLFMNEKFALYEPFASMDETELENSREGLEKLIMNRLYGYCFPPEIAKHSKYVSEQVAQDLNEDKEFARQSEKYSWINGHHLDVDLEKLTDVRTHTKEELNFMEYATQELNKINKYRAPRDKVICILNACKIIYGFLKVNKQETNADAFVPILIMIIIKAKVDHIVSNVHYIENFRGEEWLAYGETSYYLSSLQAAISFILNISCSDLSITREEYDAHLEAWAANERVKTELDAPEPVAIKQPAPQHVNESSLAPSSVLLSSAELFTKSISNLLSPSPQGLSSAQAQPSPDGYGPPSHPPTEEARPDPALIDQTAESLKEIFPDLDSTIMKDIVIFNKGDMDASLDACLQLVNDT